MHVAQALALARGLGVARLDAQLLLAFHLQTERSWLVAHDDAELDERVAQAYGADLARRADDVPLAYLTGWREFRGLRLRVNPAVLVPRPESETLVEWALDVLREHAAAWLRPALADLGTGSGAIALALKSAWPPAVVTATDDSEVALHVARTNALNLGVSVDFARGSWWQALPGQRFHVVVSNPPYIAAGDPHLPALRHEPLSALSPGGDGLAALDAIATEAGGHLHAGAWLLLEHGYDQAGAVAELLRAQGFVDIATKIDLAGLPRCTGGRWP